MSTSTDKMIIVTGAAGLIGSAVLRYLNDQGIDSIVAVDLMDRSDKWRHLVGKRFFELLQAPDLPSWLCKHAKHVQALIHLGACSDTMEADGDYLLKNNTHYTIELAKLCLENHIRFLYASSAATYGSGQQGFCDDHARLSDLRPLNMYGFSKHLFDLWAWRKGVLSKMVGLKYFNVFGPNEGHKGRMASVITRMVPQALQEKRICLFQSTDPGQYSDGNQVRDFLYVKDAARMSCAFLQNRAGGIFNIGSGKPTTWNTLAQAVIKALDVPAHIEYIAMPEPLKKRYQNYTCADMTKFYTAGLIGAQWKIEDAVRDYVTQHLLTGEVW